MMMTSLMAAMLMGSPVAHIAAIPPPPPPPWVPFNGDWVVDLSTDQAEPYTQPMQLTINLDKTVSGSFYNSEILSGRVGYNQGRSCISFTTTDGAGTYYHAACLTAQGVEGQSWAEHRTFVLPWTAKRPVEIATEQEKQATVAASAE